MKIHRYKSLSAIIGLFASMVFFVGCEDLVEKGYTVDYGESDAEFLVETIGPATGAVGDTISFRIEVHANNDIKSCVVQATNPGDNGSGYDVRSDEFDDPFADHNFGTMQNNIRSFVIKYNYIIPEDINSSKITFTVVEQDAKASNTLEISVVNSISKYLAKELYAKDHLNYDAFATIDGVVYPDIKTNYSSQSEENISVQEKIDVLFYVNNGTAVIASPGYEGIPLQLDIENETLFKKLTNIGYEEFGSITAAELVAKTKKDSISYYGEPAISNIQVGDIIGFSTDINAVHSGKTGLIRIKQLHPTSIERYSGTSYVMECDIVTQID